MGKKLFLFLLVFVPLCGIAFQSSLDVRVGQLENRVGTIEGYLLLYPTQEVATATLAPTFTPTNRPPSPTMEFCLIRAKVNTSSKLNVRAEPAGAVIGQLNPGITILFYKQAPYPKVNNIEWVRLETGGWVAKSYLTIIENC